MDRTPVFREIEPFTDYSELQPGFYTIGCRNMFTEEQVLAHMSSPLSTGCLSGCFTGMLMPYFMHNINNLMVGVMGNLDLAGMFMPQADRVEPKLKAARAATMSVVDFIRDISDVYDCEKSEFFQNADLRKTLLLLQAACGRSVSTLGLDSISMPDPVPCRDSASVRTALNGLAAWAVICLGGSGSVEGSFSGAILNLKWSRPSSAGKPHMPGREHSATLLALSAGLLVSSGVTVVIDEWTDTKGGVSIVFIE